MGVKGEGRSASAATTGDRRPLGWPTSVVKLAALAAGGTVCIVVTMSLVGLVTSNPWVALVVAVVVTIGLPLLVADRLLPDDGSARPGLVTDVVAVMWMLGATLAVALGPSALRRPLEQQALVLDAEGWVRTAWVTRWTAGVPTPALAVVEEAVVEVEPGPPSTAVEPAPASPAAGAEFTAAPEETERAALTPAALFKAWAPSVVTLIVDGPGGKGVGTGFVIDARGTIVTNAHVVSEAIAIEVKLFDGTKADDVELLESNSGDDLAVLRIKVATLPPAVVLGSSDAVEVGEQVIVIGNPIGLEHTMTDGMVSSRRVYEGKKYIQMSAPVSPGNSGGPVFNTHGDVIGITVAKLWGENLNLAVPIDVLKPMIKSEYPAARGFGDSRW